MGGLYVKKKERYYISICSRKIIGYSILIMVFFWSVFISQVIFLKKSLPMTVYACNSRFWIKKYHNIATDLSQSYLFTQ